MGFDSLSTSVLSLLARGSFIPRFPAPHGIVSLCLAETRREARSGRSIDYPKKLLLRLRALSLSLSRSWHARFRSGVSTR